MSKPLASAGTTANVLLTDAQSAAIAAKEKYKTHAKWRLRLAYVLKAIALFGGLFVATVKIDPTVPGIIISAAVILDQLTSNHRRMLADTTAASAIDRTERRVGNAYNDKITAIVAAIEKGGGPDAEALLTTLVSDSAKALRDELDKIHTAVEASNIEYLSSLNLDRPTQTVLPGLPPPTTG